MPRPWAHPQTPAPDEVPVRTRRWCTAVMIPCAVFCCLAQCSFAAQRYVADAANAMGTLMIVATLLSFVLPFVLLLRDARPEPVFWCCCAIVSLLPYSPALMLMSLTSLLARRRDRSRTLRAIVAGSVVSVWAETRDAYHPADSSFWHMVFAKPGTGTNGVPLVPLTDDLTIVIFAIVAAMTETLVAVLIGLHIRSKAALDEADARVNAARHHAENLQTDLNNQQLADAIAAEAHDTLAHSLSLIALNASALQTEASHLPDSAQARTLAQKAEDIRRQSAGALDEAHSIINMLRDPAQAWRQLGPSTSTSLTRESLDDLITDVRNSGMQLNTWIDISQISTLDDDIAKVAYRAVQEGLTNARRHAPGTPVSLEVAAAPQDGVHIHISNPVPADREATREAVPPAPDMPASATTPSAPSSIAPAQAAAPVSGTPASGKPSSRTGALPSPDPASRRETPPGVPEARNGAGLPGLVARVRSAGGTCRYGVDERHVFHVDVTLPWHG
ncbi:two-component sensor kinase [Bifidobacterium sp. DSM 109958]|uniref:histidine kinase n=2 Tax=Bifidobacterium moraviense TaxID=2675323 RepID=A0A7Y0F1N5_9BIFI|nr:two-component sensor kinase [Bifidobacterium sp. DSM 109958]